MELTIKFIESNFNKFNQLYFNGELKTPKFLIMHTKTRLGVCKFNSNWSYTNHRYEYSNFRIGISDYFARDEKQYQNTILHEMIHLYIRQNNIKDTRRHHGAVFYREADRLNQYGWNIARCDSVAGIGLTNDSDKKVYHLVAFKDSKGKYFLMAYNPKSYTLINGKLNRYHYTDIIWFTSTDSKTYAHYSECRKSLRGYFISKQEYDKLCKENEYKLAV